MNLPSCGQAPGVVPIPSCRSGSGWRRRRRVEVHGSPFPPAPRASSSGVAQMFLLQSLQTRGSRGSKRRAAKAPQELESGPESNPVRAFSPGSSCTPLWSPAKGVLQQRCFPPDGGETSGREGPSVSWICCGPRRSLRRLRPGEELQSRLARWILQAPGSRRPLVVSPRIGFSFPLVLGQLAVASLPGSLIGGISPTRLRGAWRSGRAAVKPLVLLLRSRHKRSGVFRWTVSPYQPRSSHVLDTKLTARPGREEKVGKGAE